MAQRCLYGVDKNPMAVDLAKLSLWLATLAKDHPFTFLDHALKCGDSLVGLTKSQILGFHWKPEKQRDFARAAIEGQLGRALEQRRQIREAPDGTSEALLRERLRPPTGFSIRDAAMVISSSPLSSRPTTIGDGGSGSSRCRTTSRPSAASSTWRAISGLRRP